MAKRKKSDPDFTFKGRDGSVWVIEAKGGPSSELSEMDFAEMLRRAIQKSGISQYHLSKAAGVPQGAISVFLAGGDLRLNTFTSLAHIMGLELQQNLARAPKKIKPGATHSKQKA